MLIEDHQIYQSVETIFSYFLPFKIKIVWWLYTKSSPLTMNNFEIKKEYVKIIQNKVTSSKKG